MKNVTVQKLLESLVAGKQLSAEAASSVLKQNKNDQAICAHLINTHHVDAENLAQLSAKLAGTPLMSIESANSYEFPQGFIDSDIIHQHSILPFYLKDNILYLALSDVTNQKILKTISKEKNVIIKPIIVAHDKLTKLITTHVTKESASSHSSAEPNTTKVNAKDYSKDLSDSKLDRIDLQLDEVTTADTSDFPVVRFINKIILDSINRKASDIHFEPYENAYRIRVRIDGVLYELAQPDGALAPRLSARLKVMAGLDISERRIPQDGRFKLNLGKGKTIGFRVNTCPTLFGEKIVLRILDPQTVQVGIDGLGLDDKQKEMFVNAIQKHQGMILVTGPTGSGKTVTLYTALNMLNDSQKNISTAEDPVEIYLPGINQVNINPKTGLNFAAVLRAFLRQDPDIIMVGEIRDKETAEIGIKAAQTGHLVLSTLHTNSATETLTRLENMGTAAFNIATSVNLVVAQRLVRKLCDHCKTPYELNRSVLIEQGFDMNELSDLKIYKPAGCDQCTAGYKGRIGIFEILKMTPEISDVIMNNGTSIDIYNAAIAEGMVTLREAGLDKVKQGLTSLEEINRVTS